MPEFPLLGRNDAGDVCNDSENCKYSIFVKHYSIQLCTSNAFYNSLCLIPNHSPEKASYIQPSIGHPISYP